MMDWQDLGDGVLGLENEIGRWTIRPHRTLYWCHLVLEVDTGRDDLFGPDLQLMRFEPQANTVPVGFFASSDEAAEAFMILDTALRLDQGSLEWLLDYRGYTPKQGAGPRIRAITRTEVFQQGVEPARDEDFSWLALNDGTDIEMTIGHGDQPTVHSFKKGDYDGHAVTASFTTAPNLYSLDGERIELMPNLDHALVQVHIATHLLARRKVVDDERVLPLDYDYEDELAALEDGEREGSPYVEDEDDEDFDIMKIGRMG